MNMAKIADSFNFTVVLLIDVYKFNTLYVMIIPFQIFVFINRLYNLFYKGPLKKSKNIRIKNSSPI